MTRTEGLVALDTFTAWESDQELELRSRRLAERLRATEWRTLPGHVQPEHPFCFSLFLRFQYKKKTLFQDAAEKIQRSAIFRCKPYFFSSVRIALLLLTCKKLHLLGTPSIAELARQCKNTMTRKTRKTREIGCSGRVWRRVRGRNFGNAARVDHVECTLGRQRCAQYLVLFRSRMPVGADHRT